jgi:hypothetical protein
MKLTRLFFLLSLTIICSVISKAETTPSKLIILMKDSTTQEFLLADKPTVTFDSTKVYIKSKDFSAIFDEVQKFYFKVDSTVVAEIEDIKSETPSTFVFQFTDGRTVTILGCKSTDRLAVYSANGMKVAPEIERSGDKAVIRFDNQPSGIYIIRVNSNSYNILKR